MSASTSDIQTLFKTAVGFHQSHKFAEARALFEQCLPEATEAVMRLKIHNFLGQCCFAMGEAALSFSHFKAAVTINEQSEEGRLITGFCLNWLGQTDAALALANKVVTQNPHCDKAYFLMRAVYQKLGDDEKVKETEEKFAAVIRKREKKFARQSWDLLPNNVNRVSLEPYLVPASETERVKEVLFRNGCLDTSLGRFMEGFEDFQKLLKFAPDHYKAMYGAGRCLFELDRKEEAKQFLEEALRLNPEFKQAKVLLEKIKGKKS